MKYVEGNLLDMAEAGDFDIIVHGCNCFCTMGSGIARQIKDRYPKAFLVDNLTERGNERKLGKFTQAYIDGTTPVPAGKDIRSFSKPFFFTIINAYTQHGFMPRDKVNVDYVAVANVFMQIKLLYDMNPHAPAKIGIPMIGAGLAGGDWDTIEEIIDGIGFSDITCVTYREGNK